MATPNTAARSMAAFSVLDNMHKVDLDYAHDGWVAYFVNIKSDDPNKPDNPDKYKLSRIFLSEIPWFGMPTYRQSGRKLIHDDVGVIYIRFNRFKPTEQVPEGSRLIRILDPRLADTSVWLLVRPDMPPTRPAQALANSQPRASSSSTAKNTDVQATHAGERVNEESTSEKQAAQSTNDKQAAQGTTKQAAQSTTDKQAITEKPAAQNTAEKSAAEDGTTDKQATSTEKPPEKQAEQSTSEKPAAAIGQPGANASPIKAASTSLAVPPGDEINEADVGGSGGPDPQDNPAVVPFGEIVFSDPKEPGRDYVKRHTRKRKINEPGVDSLLVSLVRALGFKPEGEGTKTFKREMAEFLKEPDTRKYLCGVSAAVFNSLQAAMSLGATSSQTDKLLARPVVAALVAAVAVKYTCPVSLFDEVTGIRGSFTACPLRVEDPMDQACGIIFAGKDRYDSCELNDEALPPADVCFWGKRAEKYVTHDYHGKLHEGFRFESFFEAGDECRCLQDLDISPWHGGDAGAGEGSRKRKADDEEARSARSRSMSAAAGAAGAASAADGASIVAKRRKDSGGAGGAGGSGGSGGSGAGGAGGGPSRATSPAGKPPGQK